MSEDIKKHYKDILPEDVKDEVAERIKEIELHQEEVVSDVKETLPDNFVNLKFI